MNLPNVNKMLETSDFDSFSSHSFKIISRQHINQCHFIDNEYMACTDSHYSDNYLVKNSSSTKIYAVFYFCFFFLNLIDENEK